MGRFACTVYQVLLCVVWRMFWVLSSTVRVRLHDVTGDNQGFNTERARLTSSDTPGAYFSLFSFRCQRTDAQRTPTRQRVTTYAREAREDYGEPRDRSRCAVLTRNTDNVHCTHAQKTRHSASRENSLRCRTRCCCDLSDCTFFHFFFPSKHAQRYISFVRLSSCVWLAITSKNK